MPRPPLCWTVAKSQMIKKPSTRFSTRKPRLDLGQPAANRRLPMRQAPPTKARRLRNSAESTVQRRGPACGSADDVGLGGPPLKQV